ncbi:ribosomal protein S18 acetylase RimI-like enzyme [Paenibacillus phyllosphaerae]|uniref:Ribosomal protein S18 acetylase RimI-like enzyme n=1 Tax=Paenibacillus phyllosphaerae TaxID=274593 RepID=A0A7W5ATW1_9BACL|nr:GNAT family N-acetyltransferase [Paenibacillus phyllosphaerae]MBB3108693.1 ribosomal protein S18 acetylase RimI-like enzyme [Paenibacillus phyllosphaerae]
MNAIALIRRRRPRTDDKEIIRLIRTELMPLSHTANPKDTQTIRELPKRLREGVTFVISHKKTSMPLGFLHLYIIGDILQYDMLAVHPDHRGKQWGRLLMSHGEAYGRSNNCTAARLFVDEGNDKAHRLYRKLGFATVRYYAQIRCYEMVKRLNSAT